MMQPARTIKVLAIQRTSELHRAKIAAVDPAVELTDAGGWFDGEIRDTWPAFASARYLPRNSTGSGTREERDRLLAEAEVILGGWPFPIDLRARARKLKWFHQLPAGASNLLLGDLWGSDVVVTTSRGRGNTLAMAEYALAGMLHFAKGLRPRGHRPRGRPIRPSRLPAAAAAKARPPASSARGASEPRSAGLPRRSACAWSARAAIPLPVRRCRRGSSALGGPGDLDRFLAESDFVVICCHWTPKRPTCSTRIALR